MNADEIEQRIKRAAERARGAPVRFVEAVPIIETFRGEVIWEGAVSEFESDAGKVYAWAVEGGKEPQFIAVLNQPPITSPLSAVRAWLVSLKRSL
jgi:hypothetical protein